MFLIFQNEAEKILEKERHIVEATIAALKNHTLYNQAN
jgi:hypothetical protein